MRGWVEIFADPSVWCKVCAGSDITTSRSLADKPSLPFRTRSMAKEELSEGPTWSSQHHQERVGALCSPPLGAQNGSPLKHPQDAPATQNTDIKKGPPFLENYPC